LAACESHWGEAPGGDVPLPDRLAFASSLDGPAARFIGQWWGTYDVGREVVLAVTNIIGTKVEAVYAYGPMPAGRDKGGFVRRVGLADGDALEFANENLPTLRYKLETDGRLHGTWISPDGRATFTTLLRKLPP